MSEYATIPLGFERLDEPRMRANADGFFESMARRRSVREFSDEPLPLDVVRRCIHAAGQAPSGAHKQPWRFVLITDPAIKHEIREAAEDEERETYEHRMSDEWRAALAPIGTDADKPFLDVCPALIAMFRCDYELLADGSRRKNYYVQESCGIALGILIAALTQAGIACLTHTPSPMAFLAKLLDRPVNEKAFILLPIGYPASGCRVPDLDRKPLGEILIER
ncbi:nitroreductase family protein [Nannocystaceae bacterium ST9]